MINGKIIVDGHVHTFSTGEVSRKITGSFNRLYTIEFPNPGSGTVEDVLGNMDRAGIDYTVMANFAPPRILHENNLWTIDTGKANKSLIPLVSFHPEMKGRLRSFLECYMNEGARGIKLHPMAQGFHPDHPGLREVYEYCNDVCFPIVFHCGRVANARLNNYSDLDAIMPVIKKYHDIPFVLTHMADGNRSDVYMLAEQFENVFFDTSIVISGYPPILQTNRPTWTDDNEVVAVIKKVGAARILFGSDYPWGSPVHDLNRFIGLEVEDEELELILGKNTLKLFNIV